MSKKNWIVIIDGPPASGKSTFCKVLSQKYGCRVLSYKRLGLCNVVLYVVLKLLYFRSAQAINLNRLVRDRIDPITLFDKKFLAKNKSLIFICEIFYKFIQIIKFLFILLLFRKTCIVVDEYIALSTANYVNLYLHSGLHKSHLYFLFRLDLSIINFVSYTLSRKIFYFYIDRDISILTRLWSKRSARPYDITFLAMLRVCYRTISQYIKVPIRHIYVRDLM
jgi:hypothetical protein